MEIIRFVGPWSTEEQRTLRNAIHEIEPYLNVPVPPGLRGKQWVCHCVREGRDTVFTASRINLDHLLWDSSLLGLLKKVYRLTWERAETRFAHPNKLFVYG